ncbi:MAG: hypothetical protein AB7E47_03370 [Desulfovibrionaceae bacterium]
MRIYFPNRRRAFMSSPGPKNTIGYDTGTLTYALNSFNVWYRAYQLAVTNGHIITHLGCKGSNAGEIGLGLLDEAKVLQAKIAASHTGTGWEWFALDAPITVDAAGWSVCMVIRSGSGFVCRSDTGSMYYQLTASQSYADFTVGENFGADGGAGNPVMLGYGYN